MSKLKKASVFALCLMLTVAFMPFSSFAEAKAPEPKNIQVNEKGEVQSTNVAPVDKDTSDNATYSVLHYFENANKKYVDTSKVDMADFAQPVTIAKGVATYNYKKQKEYKVNANSIMSMYYEVPIYDLDKDGDYYVAFPNVNMGDERINGYDFMLAYNNDRAEMINGYHFEKNIVYIPKDDVDNPKNENQLNSDEFPIAMQLNYYFKDFKDGQEADFSKKIPVQILKGEKPEYKTVEVENMFADESVSFEIGDYDKSKIHVMLNGSVLPINEMAYSINDGLLTINSSAAVISSINIVVDGTTVADVVKSFTDTANASVGVSPDQMAYYKTAGGKEVIITSNLSDIYVGWRGHYQAARNIISTPADQSKTQEYNKPPMSTLLNLPEWKNSLNYMYGAYTNVSLSDWNHLGFRGFWALASYTKGVSVEDGSSINKTREYENPFDPDSSNVKKTIYEWMLFWADRLEKNNGATDTKGGGDPWLQFNGLGSFNNFAVPWPKSLITGDDTNLISDTNSEGYGRGNPNIKFDTETESGKSVLGPNDYFAAACAHISEDAAEDGTFDGENNRTVYVSCIAKGDDYVVLCFAIAGITRQEAMGIYKFRTGRPIQIKKESMESKVSSGNSLYSLENAKYKLYETETDARNNTDVVASFTTEANGESNIVTVAPGDYWLVETTPSEGHIIPNAYKKENGGKKITVTSGADTQVFTMEQPIIRGDVYLEKWDKELNKSEAIGGKGHDASTHAGTDLNGIQFTIYNKTGHQVVVPKVIDPKADGYKTVAWGTSNKGEEAITNGTAKIVANNGEVGIITTHWDDAKKAYVARTGGLSLPKGTYEIKETRTNKYYELTDTAVRTIEITEHGKVVEKTKSGDSLVWKDLVHRQPFKFKKIGVVDGKKNRLAFIPFKITNITTGESHYVVTNQNGQFDSEFYPHDQNTNGYNEAIETKLASDIEAERVIDCNDLKALMLGDEIDSIAPGTWFAKGEDGSVATVDNSKPAFPYGTYEVEELRCSNNKEFKLITPFTFEVKGKSVSDAPEFEFDNFEANPSIGTIAKDDQTGINLGVVGDKVKIIDTVKYEDFELSLKFEAKGTLVDKSTGKPLKIDGKEVTATQQFETKTADGTIEMEFELNSSDLKGKDIVIFEEVREVVGGEPKEKTYAEHKNLGDEGQTIHFPDAGTNAEDSVTKDGVGKSGEKTTIIDTVEYKNLIEDKEYTVQGKLMDKETEKPIMVDGKEVVSEPVKFTPKEPNGKVEVTFTLDTSALKGKAIVAFEDIKYNEVTVVSHAEITDEKQTVYIPEIGTTAKDGQTESHIGTVGKNAVIIDTIEYKGLKPGVEYTVTGTLMDKSEEKPISVNGKDVTRTEKFTPETADGTYEMKFEFDSTAIAGKSAVVYEEVALKGNVVAEHKDIEDEGQTVDFNELKTTATGNGKKKLKAKGNIVVKDVVEYKNLTPNKEYTLKGTLMDKATEKPVYDNGKAVTVTKTFTPKEANGKETLEFKVSSKAVNGKTTVVYEELYYGKAKIGEHADINDKAQTVTFVKYIGRPTGKNNPPTDGGGIDGGGNSKTSDIAMWSLILLLIGAASVGFWQYRKSRQTN